jgi:hypothetical protein
MVRDSLKNIELTFGSFSFGILTKITTRIRQREQNLCLKSVKKHIVKWFMEYAEKSVYGLT